MRLRATGLANQRRAASCQARLPEGIGDLFKATIMPSLRHEIGCPAFRGQVVSYERPQGMIVGLASTWPGVCSVDK